MSLPKDVLEGLKVFMLLFYSCSGQVFRGFSRSTVFLFSFIHTHRMKLMLEKDFWSLAEKTIIRYTRNFLD